MNDQHHPDDAAETALCAAVAVLCLVAEATAGVSWSAASLAPTFGAPALAGFAFYAGMTVVCAITLALMVWFLGGNSRC